MTDDLTLQDRLERGRSALNSQNYQEAIYWFQSCLDLQREEAEKFLCAFNLGFCHEQLGNYQEAAKWYRNAAEVDPSDRTVHLSCLRTAKLMGDTSGEEWAKEQLKRLDEAQRERARAASVWKPTQILIVPQLQVTSRDDGKSQSRGNESQATLAEWLHLPHIESRGKQIIGITLKQWIEQLNLPRLQTAKDVADALRISESDLAVLTGSGNYHQFTIPKRRGGERVISAPRRRLSVAQQWLLDAILSRVPVHPAAMAYRPGCSIVANAKQHVGKRIVLRIDLKDFFPSITYPRVRGLFEMLGYSEEVARVLALLATEDVEAEKRPSGQAHAYGEERRRLPQGACSSPAITNIVGYRLDTRLAKLAQAKGFTYTRYADDLVLSHPSQHVTVEPILEEVRSIVDDEGFVINEEKTRVMRSPGRQIVTGLIVNGKGRVARPRIPRRDLRRFRAILHQYETRGVEVVSRQLGRDARAYVTGYLAFIEMVQPKHAERLRRAHPWLSQ